MLEVKHYIRNYESVFYQETNFQPWEITNCLENILSQKRIKLNNDDYIVDKDIAIHKTVIVEQGAILKGPIIISENCFVGANAYLRGPIFLGKSVKIGSGSEVKQSIIFDESVIAHLNYIGNSIIGNNVNFEAGSICANHYNERQDKNISVIHKGKKIDTNAVKFGALVGDNSKIGANAVLSPGTILEKKHYCEKTTTNKSNRMIKFRCKMDFEIYRFLIIQDNLS